MRGKLKARLLEEENRGITPAHAGKTSDICISMSAAEDHPRACGENSQACEKRGVQTGSPPRMRGKPITKIDLGVRFGITPAHAGKTGGCVCEFRRDRDHPRACGENKRCDYFRQRDVGSPPRMRGKPPAGLRHPLRLGITPAHAGKTTRLRQSRQKTGDHPRACGENTSEMAYFRG